MSWNFYLDYHRSMMKRLTKEFIIKILGALAFIAALAVLASRQEAIGNIWDALQDVSLLTLFGAFALFAGGRAIQALSLRQALLIFSERISYGTVLDLSGIKGFYNLSFQGAGIVAQAASGKSNKLFRMRNFFASTLLQSILLAFSIGISVVALSFALPEQAFTGEVALLFGLMIALISLSIIVLLRNYCVRIASGWARINSVLNDIHQSLRTARIQRLLLVGGYQLLFAWLRITRLLFITVLASPEVNMIELSAIVFTADLASLIPITPGGIGLREFIIGTGGVAMGHMEILVAAAIIDRGITIFGNAFHGFVVFIKNLCLRNDS